MQFLPYDEASIMADDSPKPWSDKPDLDWLKHVEGWHWNLVDSDNPSRLIYRNEGSCPYCGDHTFQDEPIGIGYGFLEIDLLVAKTGNLPGLPPTVPVSCNCKVKHPGHPAGKKGCGKSGEIKFAGNIVSS
jgi:hypothetical protein